MKNLIKIIVLLFVVNTVNAQIVTIPDANFKARLLAADVTNYIAYDLNDYPIKIDANNNYEIEASEVLLVKTLNISQSSIIDLTGIEYFNNLISLECSYNQINIIPINNLTNLSVLSCGNNQINVLNVSGLTNLINLNCSWNYIQNINLTGLSNLQFLNLAHNQINILDLSGLNNLINLDCSMNQIQNLDVNTHITLESLVCFQNQLSILEVNNLTNLNRLSCEANYLSQLNISNLTNMVNLFISNNPITSINVNGFVNLETFVCNNNQLSAVDLSGLVNLKNFQCKENNGISSLNLSDCDLTVLDCRSNNMSTINLIDIPNIDSLYCGGNFLPNLDFNTLPNLTFLECGFTGRNTLDVSNLVNLNYLSCPGNFFTTLDISNLTQLNSLDCGYNYNITTLFARNGSNEQLLSLWNCYNIQYVCADDAQLTAIKSNLDSNGLTNCIVNSYCSFTPGGSYNTITGSMLFDGNNNGCDANDLPQPNIKIDINDGTNQGATFTNNTGNYNFYTQAGSFDVTPNVENPSWFSFSPTTVTVPFSNNLNNTSTQNFCISANGVHPDVEVTLMPTSPARPGFDAPYKIVFKNKGNQMVSGTINLAFNDDKTDFVSATPTIDSQSTNSLTWNYTNLMPFESRSINFNLNINSPVETPAVNIGDILNFVTTINPVTDDIPADNTFNYNQTVVGSFDPNSIECLEGESVDPSYIGQYLHYGVNFENTGNYPAENIVVKVIIDTTKYDMNSLQLMDTSHNSYTRITGNEVEFIFETINLGSGGHGNILFKIKTVNDLSIGDMVNKSADIFFDYNAPIDTGMANTTFQTLSNGSFEIDDSVSVYPNPTKNNMIISCKNSIKSVDLYDAQGRLLQTKLVDDVQTSIDISEKSKGIYFLKITSNNGTKVEKVVKE